MNQSRAVDEEKCPWSILPEFLQLVIAFKFYYCLYVTEYLPTTLVVWIKKCEFYNAISVRVYLWKYL